MAYKICQFVVNYNLSSFPSTRVNSFFAPATIDLFLPEKENIFVKKIAIDAILNTSGDIVIENYSFNFILLNKNGSVKQNNNVRIINPTIGTFPYSIINLELNKYNPCKDINDFFGGIRMQVNNELGNILILNDTVSPLTGYVASFLITFYYV
jgi:hypothetical protein